jgi:predicted O-methyltransferase YrrM
VETEMKKTLLLGPAVDALLDRLYDQSDGQHESIVSYFSARVREGSLDWNAFDEDANKFLSDKLVALDRDKAEFCYQVCRALRAERVVEAGTSFGVSTLFLAAAVRDNSRVAGTSGVVVATEYEQEKAAIAKANFAAAGLSEFIELREGDLRDTLVNLCGPVDFMLIDIWTPMARPALELVAPHLSEGAVVVCDNTLQFRDAYREYFDFVNDPQNRFRTVTLPFEGGLEFTVRAS